MTAQVRGRFDGKLDPKGRLILPATYRSSLPKSASTLVITNSLFKGRRCLDVYTLREWEKHENKIAKLPSLKAEVQAYRRFYLASGQTVDLDAQNRFLVPVTLRKFAGLEDEVVLVGMGEKFEIWSAAIWTQMYEDLATQYEDILNVVAELEKGS